METKKKALGKGLEQLFTNNVISFDEAEQIDILENINNVKEIKLDDIRSNPFQPRKYFDEAALNDLANSIREHGIIQPIIVKRSIKGYDLVAGERRCRAARIAGLDTIPAIIKEYTDEEMMELALIENIQREDLNSIEEAKSIVNIMKLKGYTNEQFARRFGKSVSYVSNTVGLLKLPDNIQQMILDKRLTSSHARILSKMDNEDQINMLANKIIKENMSVRDLERISMEDGITKRRPIKAQDMDPKYRIYEETMCDKLGYKSKVGKKKLEIYYSNLEDLERLMGMLNISIDED